MERTFDEVITSNARLREVIGHEPRERTVNKVIDRIDPVCARFIAAAPFATIATRGADGMMDISPKGDPAGFVHVLDEKTLAIPDRPGNYRADTFQNVLVDPHVGLLFLVPGVTHTLRVSGTGRLVRDRALAETLTVKGHVPTLILVVDVEEAYMHCAKCMTRSGLWRPETWDEAPDVPTLGEALVAHAALSANATDIDAEIDASYARTMY